MRIRLALLALIMCAISIPAFATQTITQTAIALSGSPAITPTNANDVLVFFLKTSGGGGSPYLTALTDTQGNTWHPVIGALGASSSYYAGPDGYFYSAYWAVATAATADTLTLTFNGGTPGLVYQAVMDCAGCATTSPVITNIYRYQASPGTGANAITTAGGTGSDNVSSTPAILVGGIWAAASTVSAGANFTESIGGFNNAYEFEYRTISSTGTYDATATIAASNITMDWMVALKGVAGGSCTNPGYEPNPGIIAIPNGTSGTFLLCNGATGTPNCSSTTYYQPNGGKCGVN